MNESTLPFRNTHREVFSLIKSRGARTWELLKNSEVPISRASGPSGCSLSVCSIFRKPEGRFVFAVKELE